jgi:glutathione S-transferase
MPDGTLTIGNKRYSSWSLRGWLPVHLAGLDVAEKVIPFERSEGGGATPAIAALSPNGLVPYLEHFSARVFESLAIVEYCAEFAPLWPADRAARAHARSIAAQMHAGFMGLRKSMPMNLGRDFAGLRRTPEALADIGAIEKIWAGCLAAHGGKFLYGKDFGAADVMFAPVVTRFLTYRPVLTATTEAYCAAVRQHPLMQRWYAEAAAEPAAWNLDNYENLANLGNLK